MRGGFDPYVHAAPDFAPRRITDLELAERCLELGLAGFGADVALHGDGRAGRGGQRRRRRASLAVGSIVLNHAVGGLERDRGGGRRAPGRADRVAARRSARSASSPRSSGRPRRQRAGVGALRASSCARRARRRGRCRSSTTTARRCPSCSRCSSVVARARARARDRPSLARGDLRGRRRGGRGRRRDDRRDQPRVPVAQAQPRRPGRAGGARRAVPARAHDARTPASARGRSSSPRRARSGAARTVWGSDLGQVFNPPVEDGLALMADRFLDAGFSEEEVRIMAVENTRRLAGV